MLDLILSCDSLVEVLNEEDSTVVIQIDKLIGPAVCGGSATARFLVTSANLPVLLSILRDAKDWHTAVQLRGALMDSVLPDGVQASITRHEVAGLTVSRPSGSFDGVLCVSIINKDPRFDTLIQQLDAVAAPLAA